MHPSPPTSHKTHCSYRWSTISTVPSLQTGYIIITSFHAFSQVVIAPEFVQLLESRTAAHPLPTASAGSASAAAHPDAKPVSRPDAAAEGMQGCCSEATLPACPSSETGTEGSGEGRQERPLQDLENGLHGVSLSTDCGAEGGAPQAALPNQQSCTNGVRAGQGGGAGLLQRYPNVSAALVQRLCGTHESPCITHAAFVSVDRRFNQVSCPILTNESGTIVKSEFFTGSAGCGENIHRNGYH